MKHLYALVFSFGLAIPQLMAQYCSPTFSLGCSLWRNQTIQMGTIDWALGGTSCTESDYTSMSTIVDAGTPVQLTVSSGNWTGCAVWVDLDNDQEFEHTENLYATYVGGDPSYAYAFSITIPVGTASGPHRMRIIAPWGSDGITEGPNGFGPCGAYQYGNFDDFTINVSGTTNIAQKDRTASGSVAPNPTTGIVRLTTNDGSAWERAVVRSMDGRLVGDLVPATRGGVWELDLGDLPRGLYSVQGYAAGTWRTMPVLKQ